MSRSVPLLGGLAMMASACLSTPPSAGDDRVLDAPAHAETFRAAGQVSLGEAPMGGDEVRINIGEVHVGEVLVFDLLPDPETAWSGTVSAESLEWFDPEEPWDCPDGAPICFPDPVREVFHSIELYVAGAADQDTPALPAIPRECRANACALADYAPNDAYYDASSTELELVLGDTDDIAVLRLVIDVEYDHDMAEIVLSPNDE